MKLFATMLMEEHLGQPLAKCFDEVLSLTAGAVVRINRLVLLPSSMHWGLPPGVGAKAWVGQPL